MALSNAFGMSANWLLSGKSRHSAIAVPGEIYQYRPQLFGGAIPLKASLRLALPSKTSSSFAHAALKIGKMLMQLLEREAQRK